MNSTKVLSQMVEQFRLVHQGKDPLEIVVAPVALAALGIKQSVAPSWDKIPVTCRLFGDEEAVKIKAGRRLGVFVYNGDLRSCELN